MRPANRTWRGTGAGGLEGAGGAVEGGGAGGVALGGGVGPHPATPSATSVMRSTAGRVSTGEDLLTGETLLTVRMERRLPASRPGQVHTQPCARQKRGVQDAIPDPSDDRLSPTRTVAALGSPHAGPGEW